MNPYRGLTPKSTGSARNALGPSRGRLEEVVIDFCRQLLDRRSHRAFKKSLERGFVFRVHGEGSIPIEEVMKVVSPFLASVRGFQFRFADILMNEDGTRIVSRWQVRGQFKGLKPTISCPASLTFSGVTVWSVGPGGKLCEAWIERGTWAWLRRIYRGYRDWMWAVELGVVTEAELDCDSDREYKRTP